MPSQNGFIVRKSERTCVFIRTQLGGLTGHQRRLFNEDDRLFSVWVGGSPQAVDVAVQAALRAGLVVGQDFVHTSSIDGVFGPMPDWLQEDESGTYSTPGSGQAPAAMLLRDTRLAAQRERRRQDGDAARARRARGREAADRRWPNVDEGTMNAFLAECGPGCLRRRQQIGRSGEDVV